MAEFNEAIISYGIAQHRDLRLHRNKGLELVFLQKGTLEWWVNDHLEVLNPGSAWFTLPWHTHGSLRAREPAHQLFWILIKIETLESEDFNFFNFPADLSLPTTKAKELSQVLMNSNRHSFKADNIYKDLFPLLVERLLSRKTDELCKSLIHSIVLSLEETIKNEKIVNYTSSTDTQVAVLKTLIEQIKKNIQLNWTLQSICNESGLQKSKLTELFQTYCGETPMQHIRRLRVEHATHQMKKHHEEKNKAHPSLTEIAFDCGFSSSQYFNRVFKELYSMSPKDFLLKLDSTDPNINQKKYVWFSEAEEKRRQQQLLSNILNS